MQVNLNKAFLQGALECAAKRDIRNYLMGVCLDFVNDTEVVYIGTDGHVMFIAKETLVESTGISLGTQIVIPRASLEMALKNCTKPHTSLTLEKLEGDTYKLGGSVIFTPIEAQYPNYKRMIPKESNGLACQFLPEVIVKVHKAFKHITGQHPYFYPNGDSEASVFQDSKRTDFLVVAMPFKSQTGLNSYKPWVSPVPPEELKQAA